MTTALSDAEINEGLAKLNGWSRAGDVLTKSFKFDSYLAGVAFASTVGVIAEGLNHHPDISIGWRARDGNIHHSTTPATRYRERTWPRHRRSTRWVIRNRQFRTQSR